LRQSGREDPVRIAADHDPAFDLLRFIEALEPVDRTPI
jgi:hypothetical protein